MDFNLSDEQKLLQDSLSSYLVRYYDFDKRRSILSGPGWDAGIWRDFAEQLGVLGATLSEQQGGFGGPVEAMILHEALGSALVLEPYLEWVTLAGTLLAVAGSPLIAGLTQGSVRAAAGLYEAAGRFDPGFVATRAVNGAQGWRITGSKTGVDGACGATHFIVSGRTDGGPRDEAGLILLLVAADAEGLERRDYALIDGRRSADLGLNDVPADLLMADGAAQAIAEAVDMATVAVCAEALGVMQAALDQTVAYARQREQFGQPIGQFQVLQHRMADMHAQIQLARSMTLMATLALTGPPADRPRVVSAGKAFIADAARIVGQGAVQIHGGIGTTEELAISHYFKRLTVIESQFGSAAHHLRRMGRLSA